MDFDEDFQAFFLADGHGSLVKSVAFRSSCLKQLKNGEVLAACILGYYSLFHFGLALVLLHPEKTQGHRAHLLKLKEKREEGVDPLEKNGISHKKLTNILRDMRLSNLAQTIEDGRKLREFYNYGPRTTWDEEGNIFFGNPISANNAEKIYPEDAVEFCQKIDETISSEFANCLTSINKVTLYGLSGLLDVNNHYLTDKSFQLAEMFSSHTIQSAEAFLAQLKDKVESQVSLVNGENQANK